MSGALAERDFVIKLTRAGFRDIVIAERRPWGIDDCQMYPLFDDDLVALMRRTIPAERWSRVGDSIVVKARLGTGGDAGAGS